MKLLLMIWVLLMPAVGSAQIIINIPNPSTPCTVDFEDFIEFAQSFNTKRGDLTYSEKADTNDDGFVNFTDFIEFAKIFGLKAPTGPAVKQYLDPRCNESRYEVFGHVTHLGRPLDNVWINVLDAEEDVVEITTKANQVGDFDLGLYNGQYRVAPQKYGFAFTPDTVAITVQDTSMTMSSFRARRVFELVSVKVIQDGQPVANVGVQISRAVAGQASSVLGEGETDLSGLTAIRVPVLVPHTDMSGYYTVSVIGLNSNQILDSWASVALQSDDLRRLVLDVGQDVYYIPKREYAYDTNYGEKRVLTPSEQNLRIWFRDDVDESSKMALLKTVGLEDRGGNRFALRHFRGGEGVVEAVHKVKRSGLAKAVTSAFELSRYEYYGSPYLIVDFKANVSEANINQFLEEIGGAVYQTQRSGAYEIEVSDLLSQDVFEICELYKEHPVIKHIQPDIRTYAVLF